MSFFQEQINDFKKGAIYLPSIRRVRRREIETKKEDFYWGPPDYKLYPSSIKSWYMCPREFVRLRSQYSGIDKLDGIQRTRRGSAIHRELQEDFIKSERLCPFPSNITDPRMQKKLIEGWPEIPFHDFSTGFSGSVDSCMLWREEIWPVEIKTTSEPDRDTWIKKMEKGFPLTRTQWIIQLCNYIYHLRKAKYWTEPINSGILVVVNSCYDPANLEGEYEEVIKFSEYEELITELIKHLTLHRDAYINIEELTCSYPFCRVHSKNLPVIEGIEDGQ